MTSCSDDGRSKGCENLIYLSVNEVADLKGCSQRYIKMLVADGSLKSEVSVNQNNRKKYLIPISELSTHEQLKYYKSNNIEIPDELLAGRKPKAQHQHKEFDEFSAVQREEIAEWIRILNAWDEYCAKSKLKKSPRQRNLYSFRELQILNLIFQKAFCTERKKL